MVEIFPPDANVIKIMRTPQWTREQTLRRSAFALLFEHRGGHYCFHTLTKQCYRLEETELPLLNRPADGAEAAERPALKALADARFLVPEDADETRDYESVFHILRLLEQQEGVSSYTILPTSGCNARCFYCFEEGQPQITMSRELAEQTIAYILQSRTRDRKIRLTWFGGEPLLAVGTIDRICAALREKGVEFGSYLVTNGILVTEDLARRMGEDWRIERIQVSLDGGEEEYNRRKNYRVAYPSAYQTVKEKIRLLLDAGLLVQIRCNMDRNNADSLTRFVDDMAASFAGRENLCLYFALLHQERAGEKSVELLKKCQQAQLYARQAGLAFDGGGRVQRLKINKCTKDRPYRAVIIGADGQLYNCEHCEVGTAFGNVRDGVLKPEQLEELDAPEPVADKCRDCLLLPCCTPFSGCPNKTASCREFFRDELLFDLHSRIDRLQEGKRPLPEEEEDLTDENC